MNNIKPATDLLDNINTSYMSEADKITALANAQRAEFIADVMALVVGGTNKTIKKVVSITKNLVPSFAQHA
ncbi:hypothetical protein [Marinomonas transparens]|uniref:Uncharacterized protein n=1 Tax=Marinomonas transparens TaxID=2795388 RepID=A0A934JWU4_9GAMM|nr:hypothetical protein [Marinomonas transparens]MBJ7539672.1 hypothetical protein [Marinomonas transparens]